MGFEVVHSYFYIINYTLGSGFLSLPYIFYRAGVLITTLGFTFFCAFTLICALYVLEILWRVKVVEERSRSQPENETLIIPQEADKQEMHDQSKPRKYEIPEAGQILWGYWVNVLLTLLVVIANLVSSAAYASISASTLATNIQVNSSNLQVCETSQFIPIIPTHIDCLNFYRLNVGAFGVLVTFLSVLGLDKQKYLQLLMGVFRFLVIASLVLFSIIKIILDRVNPSLLEISNTHNSSHSTTEYVGILFNVDMLYTFYGIPIFLYSLQNHYFLPTAIAIVKNKKVLKQLIIAVFLTLGITLVTLGVCIALAFSVDNNPNCVLNWLPYTRSQYHISLRIFSYIVIFFPVVDLISCYPLTCIMVSNLLFNIIMRRDTSQINTFAQRIVLLSLRFIVAFLPLILGLFVANLILISDICGLFSIALILMTPVLFQFRSQMLTSKITASLPESALKKYERVKRMLFSPRSPTPYSGWYSSLLVQISVIIIATLTFVVCTVSVIIQIVYAT